MDSRHILTARHCVAIQKNKYGESEAYGYNYGELVSPDQVRVGLGSLVTLPGYAGYDWQTANKQAGLVIHDVQQIRAAESVEPGKKSTKS